MILEYKSSENKNTIVYKNMMNEFLKAKYMKAIERIHEFIRMKYYMLSIDFDYSKFDVNAYEHKNALYIFNFIIEEIDSDNGSISGSITLNDSNEVMSFNRDYCSYEDANCITIFSDVEVNDLSIEINDACVSGNHLIINKSKDDFIKNVMGKGSRKCLKK